MEAKDTVMSESMIKALLRGCTLNLLAPECIDPKGNAPSLESFIAKAQAEITWKARELEIIEARKAGIREVVDSFIEAEVHSDPNSRVKAFEKVLKAWQAKLKVVASLQGKQIKREVMDFGVNLTEGND